MYIWPIHRILESVRAKNIQATLLFVDFTKAFDSIHRGKMEQILLAYGLPKETVAAITILYRNTKVKVRSPDGDTVMIKTILKMFNKVFLINLFVNFLYQNKKMETYKMWKG